MICLKPKQSKRKISEIIRVSLWPTSRPDFNPLDYAIWDVFENKTNTTSRANIGSLKTAIEEEWNKLSEEVILKGIKIVSKACWYNNWKKWW